MEIEACDAVVFANAAQRLDDGTRVTQTVAFVPLTLKNQYCFKKTTQSITWHSETRFFHASICLMILEKRQTTEASVLLVKLRKPL